MAEGGLEMDKLLQQLDSLPPPKASDQILSTNISTKGSGDVELDMDDLLAKLDELPPPESSEKFVLRSLDPSSDNSGMPLPGLDNLLKSVEKNLQSSGKEDDLTIIDSKVDQNRDETLENLVRTLHKNIKSSDWLTENTAEKWEQDNPEVAQEYRKAAEQYKKSSS